MAGQAQEVIMSGEEETEVPHAYCTCHQASQLLDSAEHIDVRPWQLLDYSFAGENELGSVACENCGQHGVVTATEKTSEAPNNNQYEINLENQQESAVLLSPIMSTNLESDQRPTHDHINIEPSNEMTLTDPHQVATTSEPFVCDKCKNCQDHYELLQQRATTAQPEVCRPQRQKLVAYASESQVRKTSANVSKTRAISILQQRQRKRYETRTPTEVKMADGASSLRMPLSRDSSRDQKYQGNNGRESSQGLLNEHQQINLQIKMGNEGDHSRSQPKIIHHRRDMHKPAKGTCSQKSRQSKRSIRLRDGNIICRKCANCVPAKPQAKKGKPSKLRSSIPPSPTHATEMACKELEDQDINARESNHENANSQSGQSVTELQPTRHVESGNLPMSDLAIFVDKNGQDIFSHDTGTDKLSEDGGSRKIRDSIEFTSHTETARQKENLGEMSEEEHDLLSDQLISDLRAIALGNFELAGDPTSVSAIQSEQSVVKSNRLNLMSLGALTVKDENYAALDAQSNIATNEINSVHQTSIMQLHSDAGSKLYLSNTRGEANQVASGAFCSHCEYSNSKMVNEVEREVNFDDDESFEEEMEQEIEEEFEEEMEEKVPKETLNKNDELDQNSHATSFSDWYVIDEEEEARLKQLAFEKYLAEQAIEEQMENARLGIMSPTQRPPMPDKKAVKKKKKNVRKGLDDYNKQSEKKDKKGSLWREDEDEGQGTSIELHDRSAQYTRDVSLTQEPPQPFESFQTGKGTMKAFCPERLYEEANGAHNTALESQKTRMVIDPAQQNLLPVSEMESASEYSPNKRHSKVKFTMDTVQSNQNNPIQMVHSLKDLQSNDYQLGSSRLVSPVQKSHQLITSEMIIKRGSQPEPFNTYQSAAVNAFEVVGSETHLVGKSHINHLNMNRQSGTEKSHEEVETQNVNMITHLNLATKSSKELGVLTATQQAASSANNTDEPDLQAQAENNKLHESSIQKTTEKAIVSKKKYQPQIQPGSGEYKKENIKSPTSGESRSRRSHRLKVKMVDRSQQDSRCEPEGEQASQLPQRPNLKVSVPGTAVFHKPQAQTSSIPQSPHPVPEEPAEPEKVEWVIVLGQRRPQTQKKPTAAGFSFSSVVSPRDYVTGDVDDSEPKFSQFKSETRQTDLDTAVVGAILAHPAIPESCQQDTQLEQSADPTQAPNMDENEEITTAAEVEVKVRLDEQIAEAYPADPTNTAFDESILVAKQISENVSPNQFPAGIRSHLSQDNLPYQVKVTGSRRSSQRDHSIVDLPIDVSAPELNGSRPQSRLQYKDSNHITLQVKATECLPQQYQTQQQFSQMKGQRTQSSNILSNPRGSARRPTATQASYFKKQGNQGLRSSPNTVARNNNITTGLTKLKSMRQTQCEVPPQNNVASKYMAHNETTNILVNTPWNENTDRNLSKFIKKRTNKGLKQIDKEVEEVKPIMFDNSKFTAFQWSNAAPVPVPDLNEFISIERQPYMINSDSFEEAQLEPALQKYVQMKNKPSDGTFKPLSSQKKTPYMTLQKDIGNRDSSNELIQPDRQFAPVGQASNFSSQYQRFRSVRKGRSERRNIQQSKSNKKTMSGTCDMYFHGQITTDEEITKQQRQEQQMMTTLQLDRSASTAAEQECTGRKYNRSSLGNQNHDRLNETFPINQKRLSQCLLNNTIVTKTDFIGAGVCPSQPFLATGKLHRNGSNSSAQVFKRLKQSIQNQVAATATITASPMKSQRMRYYPQTIVKARRGASITSAITSNSGVRLNPHLAQAAGRQASTHVMKFL